MKKKVSKKIVAALALACATAFTAPAFAAPGDAFADVPAKHWSYSAIQKLAKDGIVSADTNRFNGEKTVTRYEMAILVANAMTKLEKADANQKALIQQLQLEYQDDLKALGARVDALEKKVANAEKSAAVANAKAKVNFFFDNRIQYNHTSLKPTDPGGALATKPNVKEQDQIMERLRVYMSGNIGDEWSWNSRLHYTKWNIGTTDSATKDATVKFDRMYVTNKNIAGGQLDLGRQGLFPGKALFWNYVGDTDAAVYTRNFDKLKVSVTEGRLNSSGSENTKVRWADLSYRPNKNVDIGLLLLKSDFTPLKTKDMNIIAINGAAKINDGLALSFEWGKNRADDSLYMKGNQSAYFVALQSKYEATNIIPGLYTTMVNPFVKGDHAWGVSYRHMPAGAAGIGNRGTFSGWVPATTDQFGAFQNGSNDINAWRFDYVYVPWKNVQWTLTYDHIKPINGNWTNNSIQSTFNFFF